MEQPLELKRSLRFRDLVLYGIVLIQPTAPMPVFGVLYQKSHGHVTLTILLALVAMLFTAISYGRMARAYPRGGSAFLYVGKELHPALGYFTGWALVMDYVINPLICTIWCSSAAMNFVPQIPYVAWAVGFVTLFTTLNCNGIETSARINAFVAAALALVVVWILATAVHWLLTRGTSRRRRTPGAAVRAQSSRSRRCHARHRYRRACLHRLRRHLHSGRRSSQSAPRYPTRHRHHVLRHGHSRRQSRSTSLNWSGRAATSSPTSTPPTSSSPATSAEQHSSKSSTSRCCLRPSAPGWRRNSVRHACYTRWAGTALCLSASSVWSTIATAFRATTWC